MGCDDRGTYKETETQTPGVETIDVGGYPNGIAVNETYMFVVLGAEHAGPDSLPEATGVESVVQVFNLDGTFVTEIVVDGGGHSMLATQDGDVLVAHFSAENSISVIDTDLLMVRTELGGNPPGNISLPDALSLSADGQYAYVGSNGLDGSGWLARIILEEDTVDENWKSSVAGGATSWVEADDIGLYLYANSWTGGTTQRKDAVTGADAGSLEVGEFPHSITFNQDQSFGYVAVTGGNDLVKIRLLDFTKEGSIPGPWDGLWGDPSNAVLSAEGNFLFVANHDMGYVAVLDINPASATYDTVVEIIQVGADPIFQTLTKDGDILFISNNGDGSISRVDVSQYR